ncbi:MAG: hypothetical protein JXM73_04675 [Anaerolineae bacterium]|nr:hypothetical protein [Anaerolineae bacterium]
MSGSKFTTAYSQGAIANLRASGDHAPVSGNLRNATYCPACAAGGLAPSSSMLPIVEPAANAPATVLAPFQQLLPGSAAVALQRDPAGPVYVYYEGGLYTRPAGQDATPEERRDYAVNAAGRAVEDYPTRAWFALPDWTGLQTVGYVDTERWWVYWEALSPDLIIPDELLTD